MHRRILLAVVLAFLGSLDVLGSLGIPDMPGLVDAAVVSAQTPPPVPALPPAQAPPAAPKPPAPAPAQAPQSEISGCRVSEMTGATQDALSKLIAGKTERVLVLTGKDAVPVQVDCDETQFFADFAEVYPDSHRIVATGNVKVGTPTSYIIAERVEFDTQTRTGVFYNANGMAALGDRVDKSFFGTQEADALFRGREIHKLGPKKYKVVDGAFSTCVQPTPRWEVVSGSATINLDDYALLKNSVFRVKGVPLMYLPIFYYPIQEDDRATGFLLPTYGSSTFRGQSLSNAFFWAISRNQDATFEHDWYSKAGQAVGAEYRYVLSAGSQGNARFSFLDEKTTDASTGAKSQGDRSYQITGGMAQSLGGHFRARANADYVSSIAPEQLYQQNIYRATRSTRSFGGNLTGSWTQGVLSATMDRTDVFYPDGAYTTYGGLPRINFTRPERRIASSPFYFGAGAESATILRDTVNADGTSLPGQDQGLTRMDFNPVLRIPFTKWPFLTINSAVSWRGTYWTESLVNGRQASEPLWRNFFDFSSTVTGPVLSRIFNAGDPEATKIKHVIEPVFTIRRRTAIDVFDQIVQLDSADYIRGNVWEVRYGLNNRLYAKRKTSREVLSVALNQTYYTDSLATLTDYQYQSSSYAGKALSKFTALSLYARTAPTTRLQGDFRTEWDPTFKTLKTLAANGALNNANMQVAAGWSRRRFIPGLPGFDNEQFADHYLNASANWHKATNTLGFTYTFNYDLRNDTFLQQRYLAYYNAQCCGFGVEYQTYNFSASTYRPYTAVTQDKRFNISFTLAGIGTFSNLLGAFGGQNTR
jgi:lipopolysaccharide assembly outer membrane protein LptD (OstA)